MFVSAFNIEEASLNPLVFEDCLLTEGDMVIRVKTGLGGLNPLVFEDCLLTTW